jgi:cytochrome bd-type quinol oxidase subunit 1
VLFAWPDEKAEMNRFEIAIPKAGSLILKHDPNGLFPGLKSVPPADRPPLIPVFFAFRIMVGVGVLMIAAGLVGAWLWWRRRLFEARWYLWPVAHGWWLGFVAVISGWIVTETGRQPWLVHGVLRTADATSPVPGASIATTLALFGWSTASCSRWASTHQPAHQQRSEGRAVEPSRKWARRCGPHRPSKPGAKSCRRNADIRRSTPWNGTFR